jgi:hypothetical protein
MPAFIKDHISTRLWRTLSTAFAATAAMLLVAAGASAAAPQPQPQPAQLPGNPVQLPGDFPQPGTQFKLPLHVEGWTLDFADAPSTSSPAEQGGAAVKSPGVMAGETEMAMAPGAEQAAGSSVPMEVHEFRLESFPQCFDELCAARADDFNGTAPSEQATPSYLVELDDGDGADSMLTHQAGQVGWEHSMTFDFKMTITNPPADVARVAGGEQSEPLVLTTKDPAVLTGSLSSFPPQGEVYQLQNPIELVLPEDSEATVATIDKFPVQIGGI